MFYYISIIAFITLAPMNIPVEEKSITGPFPEQYQCEIYKSQVMNMINTVDNAEIKTSKCITQVMS